MAKMNVNSLNHFALLRNLNVYCLFGNSILVFCGLTQLRIDFPLNYFLN